MEIKGGYIIKASHVDVWAVLNDPDVLRKCVPGCEELEKDTAGRFRDTIKAKSGP